MSIKYAELHCLSNYSFLRGASHPEELVKTAKGLGYSALAITDECSVSGVVRAHMEAKRENLPLIIGSEFRLEDGLKLILLATDRASYGSLTSLITRARQNTDKGQYRLTRDDIVYCELSGCLALWIPVVGNGVNYQQEIDFLNDHFTGRLWITVELLLGPDDQQHLKRLRDLGKYLHIPLVAAGDVHMHCRGRRALQDTLTAIRLNKPLHHLGRDLYPNGERHLRPLHHLLEIYPEELLKETTNISERCGFSLDELRYEYPQELVPKGHTPISWLTHLTKQGLKRRWPDKVPDKVQQQVQYELALIQGLNYEAYFLTVYDIVGFARSKNILCQGRGSAANSAVCYCLGITEVDPDRMNLLFERFISQERNEPPDIDVDFEHERREEVIQYIYQKYGRDRAALAATIITYRARSAIRDVGKALGFSLSQVDQLAKSIQWWDKQLLQREASEQFGIHSEHPKLKQLIILANDLLGFPRHLSQHVGGFVISQGPLSQLVPIENAAMPDRTVIQWEKNDLEALGLLKVDVLGLGMLSAIRKALECISLYTDKTWRIEDIPAEDPEVYAMMQRADTIGVFQIESRAQMTMLPRLKPKSFYDLVIEIAIVRPGPIQGEMVHPYLRRRDGIEPVTYPSPEVEKVLQRTLGVPIFQEQVMQLSIVAAGFTPGEADQLRRSMAAWKRRGGLEKYQKKLIEGMCQRGYSENFARQICQQIQGFGEYGFPESHSASFALLAYISTWLKRYHPSAFLCALLNSQPMGFYAPAQLIQDAQRHGVIVRPADINLSAADCVIEFSKDSDSKAFVRIGLKLVSGLSQAGVERILQTRQEALFKNITDLKCRANLTTEDMEALAAGDVLKNLVGHRHKAFWQVSGSESPIPLLGPPHFTEAEPMLRGPEYGQDIAQDYSTLGFSLKGHPVALLRSRLSSKGVTSAERCWDLKDTSTVTVAGLIICRQRPGSSSGVIFLTLEDETGYLNIVVWPKVVEAQRYPLLKARLLAVNGRIQREKAVLHIVANKLKALDHWFEQPLAQGFIKGCQDSNYKKVDLPLHSRNFH